MASYEAKELIIRQVNSKFVRASGYEMEEIIGSNIDVLM
jgi:hypothetical protein